MKALLLGIALLAGSVNAASLSGRQCAEIIAMDLGLKHSQWVVIAEGSMPVVEQINRMHYDENGVPGSISSRYQCKDSTTYRRIWVEANEGAGDWVAPWHELDN